MVKLQYIETEEREKERGGESERFFYTMHGLFTLKQLMNSLI